MPCPPADSLRAFLCGNVSAAEQESLSTHLDSCPACVERLSELGDSPDPLLGALRGVAPVPASHEPAIDQLIASGPHAEVGSLIGPYRLLEKLGEGGMGAVYRARHERLGKVFALKVLPPGRCDPTRAARFDREMRAVGRLEHPHIVRATDAGEVDGTPFLVMELIDGTDLARMVKKFGPFPPPRACELIRQAALALSHAHDRGLVHRDVKPSNLLLTPDGTVKLLDLGLALATGDPPEPHAVDGDAPTHPGDHTLTQTGMGLGTRDYMAPEQESAPHAVDARADVYGLGATLHFLLTGNSPSKPAPLPPGLDGVVRRMLAADPAERYATAAEAAGAISAFLRPPPAPRRHRAVLAGVGVAACIALAIVLTRDRTPHEVVVAPPRAVPVAPMPRLVSPPAGRLGIPLGEAQHLQKAHAEFLGQPVEVTNSLRMKFALIPPGSFEMVPRYHVTITKPFRMGTTEVTRRQFEAFVRASGHIPTGDAAGLLKPFGVGSNPKTQTGTWRDPGHHVLDESPATFVSAADADAMAEYLTRTEGVKYRLPTEAEWRWACRAGAATRYPFGDNPKELSYYARHKGNSQSYPQKVGALRPNAWGLFDTLGNVREWVADGIGPYPEGVTIDPLIAPKSNGSRVQCGGTFEGNSQYSGRQPGWGHASCDCDTRSGASWYMTTIDCGFRLCRDP